MIKKLALRTNEIKIYIAINESYCIITTFYLRRTLPNSLGTFLHENAVFTICLTDQSDYSIFHFMVRLFILTVYNIINIIRKNIKLVVYPPAHLSWLNHTPEQHHIISLRMITMH